VAGVRARLELLEAERDILRTLYTYSHCLDLGDDEGWVGVFTEDGVIDVHYTPDRLFRAQVREGTRHATGVRHQGGRQLRAFVAAHDHPPKRFKHLIVEPRITVDGDEATGICYLVRVDDVGGGDLRCTSFGRYLDKYRKVGPGEWRIAERVVLLEGSFDRPL
jgi:hypothetical protein